MELLEENYKLLCELEDQLNTLKKNEKEIEIKISKLKNKISKIKNELKTNNYKNEIGYTNKMIEIPVTISGTDHETEYCSGEEEYELEEEQGTIIVSTDHLVKSMPHKYSYDHFVDSMFDENGIYIKKFKFDLFVGGCSSGIGDCMCGINYYSDGPIKWLKNEEICNEYKYPENLKHKYKYDN